MKLQHVLSLMNTTYGLTACTVVPQLLDLIVPYIQDAQTLCRCACLSTYYIAFTRSCIRQNLPSLLSAASKDRCLTSCMEGLCDGAGPKAVNTAAIKDVFLQALAAQSNFVAKKLISTAVRAGTYYKWVLLDMEV